MQSGDTFSHKVPKFWGLLAAVVASAPERRHKLGKIEAIRASKRDIAGTKAPQKTGVNRLEGERAVISRLTGAILRATLVMMLVAMPSALLPGVTSDAKQMVALVALFAGALTFVEYNATYPGLIEFRDAPPFNRARFGLLFVTVLALASIERGRIEPSALTGFLEAVGYLVGVAMDFPYSPVRLATGMLGEGASPAQMEAVRTAAGMSYLLALVALLVFFVTMRAGNWPARDTAFNVWVNLPTFEPTAGADITARLDRDARINIVLGFALPFLIPTVVTLGTSGLEPLTLTAPQTLVWTMTAWSFLPASLFMRGMAMARVADLIRAKRRQAATLAGGVLATA